MSYKGKILYAHSLILETLGNSSYFEAALGDNWKNVESGVFKIKLPEFNAMVVHAVLEYIYTREADASFPLITDCR